MIFQCTFFGAAIGLVLGLLVGTPAPIFFGMTTLGLATGRALERMIVSEARVSAVRHHRHPSV